MASAVPQTDANEPAFRPCKGWMAMTFSIPNKQVSPRASQAAEKLAFARFVTRARL
jgi:hypothetical protein